MKRIREQHNIWSDETMCNLLLQHSHPFIHFSPLPLPLSLLHRDLSLFQPQAVMATLVQGGSAKASEETESLSAVVSQLQVMLLPIYVAQATY